MTSGRDAARTREWRLAISGTFDVENYGDLLFPLLAEVELSERLGPLSLRAFSYGERSPPDWPYAVTSLAMLPGRGRRTRWSARRRWFSGAIRQGGRAWLWPAAGSPPPDRILVDAGAHRCRAGAAGDLERPGNAPQRDPRLGASASGAGIRREPLHRSSRRADADGARAVRRGQSDSRGTRHRLCATAAPRPPSTGSVCRVPPRRGPRTTLHRGSGGQGSRGLRWLPQPASRRAWGVPGAGPAHRSGAARRRRVVGK